LKVKIVSARRNQNKHNHYKQKRNKSHFDFFFDKSTNKLRKLYFSKDFDIKNMNKLVFKVCLSNEKNIGIVFVRSEYKLKFAISGFTK